MTTPPSHSPLTWPSKGEVIRVVTLCVPRAAYQGSLEMPEAEAVLAEAWGRVRSFSSACFCR